MAWRLQGPRLVLLAVAVAVAAAASMASASVFVYYPLTVNVQYTQPPVVLEPGSNANTADLSGTIAVTIGANKTSATVTIHPTYQITVYKDVLRINNTGSATYYVWIKVNSINATLPTANSYLYMTINGTTTYDISQTGTYGPIALNPGQYVTIGFKSYLEEGVPLPASAISFDIQIAYSNQATEQP